MTQIRVQFSNFFNYCKLNGQVLSLVDIKQKLIRSVRWLQIN